MNHDATLHLLRALLALPPDEVGAAVEREYSRGMIDDDAAAALARGAGAVAAAIRAAIEPRSDGITELRGAEGSPQVRTTEAGSNQPGD